MIMIQTVKRQAIYYYVSVGLHTRTVELVFLGESSVDKSIFASCVASLHQLHVSPPCTENEAQVSRTEAFLCRLFLQPRGSSHLVNRRLKISLELEVEKDKMHGYHDPNYAVLVVFLVIYFPIYIYIIRKSAIN
jgi:hypothetical protein